MLGPLILNRDLYPFYTSVTRSRGLYKYCLVNLIFLINIKTVIGSKNNPCRGDTSAFPY